MNEEIKGILIQDGVPTPDNPVKIRKLLVNKEAEEYITNLQKELDQYKNIVKEVRKILERHTRYSTEELLKILDKGAD